MDVPENIVDWLLEKENPSVRYRTMVELLDKPKLDSEVKETKKQILSYAPVKKMLDAMHPDGYWEELNPRSKIVFGKGVEYQTQTTHFILAYLAELGLTKEHPKVNKAANRYLSLQKPDGDFWNHFSCLYGMNIRTFVKLGYKEDMRVKKTLELIRNSIRWDKGYLCDTHEGKYKTRKVKSCIRGSAKILYALEDLPEIWGESFAKQIAEHFLNRHVLFKSTDKTTLVRKDAGQINFPFNWRFGLIDVLLPLAKMGYGKDARMQPAWKILDEHKTLQGKFILDKDTKCKYWKIGEKGAPNKWVTFYAYLCLKHR
ncbi:MAG: hypothetical protein ACTSQF_14855 [Candidatus Heimdallarchaeaceae archaeon]